MKRTPRPDRKVTLNAYVTMTEQAPVAALKVNVSRLADGLKVVQTVFCDKDGRVVSGYRAEYTFRRYVCTVTALAKDARGTSCRVLLPDGSLYPAADFSPLVFSNGNRLTIVE